MKTTIIKVHSKENFIKAVLEQNNINYILECYKYVPKYKLDYWISCLNEGVNYEL